MEEIMRQVNHMKNNIEVFKIVSKVESIILNILIEQGFIIFNTPIITHGMQEYNHPIVYLLTKENEQIGFLRHSPEFEKQLIVMSTDTRYMQKAPCFRQGDKGQFHVPYLHQLDTEVPFHLSETSLKEASIKVQDIMIDTFKKTLKNSLRKISRIVKISFDEAVNKYGTSSPYLWEKGDDIVLSIIENPPLFKKKRNGTINTSILPMAQPIWISDEQKKDFLNDKLSEEELFNIRVYGYDFVFSSEEFFSINRQSHQKEGIEIGGGSVRIKEPFIQRKILEIVRPKNIDSFEPLIDMLTHFMHNDIFSAGGAIGLERLSMLVADVKDISQIQPMLWRDNGTPPFLKIN